MKKKSKDAPHILSIYFGVPGTGKTTFATWLVRNELKNHCLPPVSNVPITGALELDVKKDIGVYNIENRKIIIDEAAIEYNNRRYKDMLDREIEYFKLHRHFRTSIDVFSQSHEDCDITLRRLAQKYYVLTRVTPWFILRREIIRKVGIDENTHQVIDCYSWKPFFAGGWKFIFAPRLWKYFNTVAHPDLPEKQWTEW